MNWQEVCEHPSLQNLPFKIELNERGQVVMSPTKVWHSVYQAEIALLLRTLMKVGKVLTECAIETHIGVKVADVAWASIKRFKIVKDEIACSIAPEICVEVVSASNTKSEMDEKRQLYFEMGAKEVWLCDEYGTMTFFAPEAKVKRSVLCPAFPTRVKV
jgi:Uma2 family endonuclease